MAYSLTIQEFLRKANSKHSNFYDYSLVKFKTSRDKIKIICPEHGEFEQQLSNHLFGSGCPKCGIKNKSNNKFDISIFLERSRKVHGDKYDYSKVIYNGTKTKVIIICPEHGEFEQIPESHFMGKGCPSCAGKNTSTKDFIIKANKIHQNKYDYSKTKYINAREKLTIICPEHGEFEQIACNHLSGSGCPKCALIKNSKERLLTQEEFLNQANLTHKNNYLYDKSIYTGHRDKLIITCKIHGDFEQKANNHLNGMGCPKCNFELSASKPELELQKMFENLKISFESNNRNIIEHYELDIYIPEKRLAIEFDGLYWHNEVNKPDTKYHLRKTEDCEKQNIQLIHIFEDEWLEKNAIVKSRINNLLGLNQQKIFARKCKIKSVEVGQARLFLQQNHIQGFVAGQYYYGLFYNDELVALQTFGQLRKNLGSNSSIGEYELLRFCSKLDTNVIGGASRLFKYFIDKHKPTKIISYADRRWSIGKLYETLGFKHSHNSVPNYFYVIGQKRFNRFNFRKDILISKYGCLPEDTEHNFCFNKGWYRIYDCGTKVYVWD